MGIKKRVIKGMLLIAHMGLVSGACFLVACAVDTATQAPTEDTGPPRVESIQAKAPEGEASVVELRVSKPVPYTAFKLVGPPRVVLDIQGVPGKDLAAVLPVNNGTVKDIRIERDDPLVTAMRVIVGLERNADFEIAEKETLISLSITPGKQAVAQAKAAAATPSEPAVKEEAAPQVEPHKPRIFFKPKPDGPLAQVLGVDFTLLDHGKSRLTVTTDKKVAFNLERERPKTLILTLEKTKIPDLLLRRLDSSSFEGAVDRVKPHYSPTENRLSLAIVLREMVPFHVDQTKEEVHIDFGRSDLRPREEKLVPRQFAQAEQATPERNSPPKPGGIPGTRGWLMGMGQKAYTGAPMTMDFVDADVTNILRLIGEISNLNIIWGPEVKGTVSMRLKNVPWDQALDLVLTNNNLGMRQEGNVIWVTTRAKITQLEAEEKKKREEAEAARKQKLEEKKEAKKLEPLVTEYITVNYVDVDGMKTLIEENVKGARGRISVDKGNKTIIYTDTAANIKKAKELKNRQDRPRKQVMIEARIVEATTTFSQGLGVNWFGQYETTHNIRGGTGNYLYDFSTNFQSIPSDTIIGLSFANTALTKILQAEIGLAESQGTAKTLSAPKIITRDTVEATIKQGTQIAVPSGRDTQGQTIYEMVDAVLELKVTPKITPNDMVIMNIEVKDDFPDYANVVADNVPIKTKNAQTEMMVASGDTVVIGGIFKENSSVNQEGIPWLHKIPVLGSLFGVDKTSSDKVELLIFLTPTVIAEPGEKL